ncbi:hypothetical protein [Human papillomavirus type 41]|uniref:hypothetical protein n=1 Tax=Human papillomavirus type 41 TaxID=10589 RepID=UPI0000138384|nr:hypothetical protein [Human papillomavirus type 41]CAA39616.1 ORF E4 [Human papillomavirus type 41]
MLPTAPPRGREPQRYYDRRGRDDAETRKRGSRSPQPLSEDEELTDADPPRRPNAGPRRRLFLEETEDRLTSLLESLTKDIESDIEHFERKLRVLLQQKDTI